MTMFYCPRCGRRRVVSWDNDDYVCQCDSRSKALDEEDVVKVGDWEDYTGDGEIPKQQVMLQGVGDKFWGTRASIEGEKSEELSRRGKSKEVFRQRKHEEYVKVK